MTQRQTSTLAHRLRQRLVVAGGSAALTAVCFVVLPLFQAMGARTEARLLVREVEAGSLPPPPPPPPEPEPDEPEPEPPPQLQPEVPRLDLTQLELALDPGAGSGWLGGAGALQLDSLTGGGGDGGDGLFSLADLDQRPRATFQAPPRVDAAVARAGGKVWILCIVDTEGRVTRPSVQKSTNPALEAPALEAFRKWRFEPGKRKGKAVQFRIRQLITFPAQ